MTSEIIAGVYDAHLCSLFCNIFIVFPRVSSLLVCKYAGTGIHRPVQGYEEKFQPLGIGEWDSRTMSEHDIMNKTEFVCNNPGCV